MGHVPFRRVSFLFDLGENALGLIIDAMGACWHFSIALYLLFSAHIAGLPQTSALLLSFECRGCTHSCDSPPLRVILIVTAILI